MNYWLALFIFVSPSFVFAWDAVGVFHTSEKVVVQINEYNPASRLGALLESWGPNTESVSYLSEDESVKIQCDRGTLGMTCLFRFKPSNLVTIEERSLAAHLPTGTLLPMDNEISFLNSNGDWFRASVVDGDLQIVAGKKPKS